MIQTNIFLLLLKISFIVSSCIVNENHCSQCNPITKLCIKCDKDIYSPDEKGGCTYSHKCIVGLNQCIECNEEGNLCHFCYDGYFPDENGGCSNTENCEISYRGECIKCKDDYILIGEGNIQNIKMCKSLYSGDLKNCEKINKSGVCEECKKGYYLNSGDKKCTSTENCNESIFEVCSKCNNGFYLDKKESKCKNQTGIFENCKESLDGKSCYLCEENYYFDEEGTCIEFNYCLKVKNEKCVKCSKGYFLNHNGTEYCISTENCNNGDKDIGICIDCIENYYLDYNDGKCKSNQENNDFKYCKIADNNICIECSELYELGKDNKCTDTSFCAESYNGTCLSCIDNYYLSFNHKCSDMEHCKYYYIYTCLECDDDYYYDTKNNSCKMAEDVFKNCKIGFSSFFCQVCKKDFYYNQTDHLCYSNKNYNNFYKCSKTDLSAEYCDECIEGYFLGYKDRKCSFIDNCALSENGNKCLECDSNYCFDIKKRKCIFNDKIISEEEKFYYRCNMTNDNGDRCAICDEGFILSENGLCVDDKNCIEKDENGQCKKCKSDEENSFCLNKDFGCVETFYTENDCLECDDNLNFFNCTNCLDGYYSDGYGNCIKN